VSTREFVDHYEVLQLSQNANGETLERVYRLLAKRYHPDNQVTGDAEKFTQIRESYEVLSNPEKRAAYDIQYDDNRSVVWKIFDQSSAADGREEDRRIFHGILSLLYVARRRDVRSPGLGILYIEKMLGCPRQHLEFPIWYLKQRGWIQTLDNGQLAITVDGVDKLADRDLELRTDRLLGESTLGAEPERDPESEADGDNEADFLDEAFAQDEVSDDLVKSDRESS
jgi:curved DNA-binding protein